MILSLVLVAMVAVRRGARRERMARLRAADIPDRPGFWLTHIGSHGDESGPDPDGVE